MLHHSFEMLLKAALLQHTGSVHDPTRKYSYSFARCLSIAHEDLKILSKDERATLSILDAQRDQATHYYSDLSEDLLYVHAQSAVTLFDHLLKGTFSQSLATYLPSRVLPVTCRPPTDLMLLLDNELSQVDSFLSSGKRQGARAIAKLRSILAFATGARDDGEGVSERELKAAIAKRRRGMNWDVILPEVTQLRLDTEGTGISVTMKIIKNAPLAVRIAEPGEQVVGTVIKQEVNLWDVFTLSRNDLADKLGLTGPRTSALILELDIQNDPACYGELKKKSLVFKGYSKRALDRLREAKATLDIEAVWQRHRHRFGARTRAST